MSAHVHRRTSDGQIWESFRGAQGVRLLYWDMPTLVPPLAISGAQLLITVRKVDGCAEIYLQWAISVPLPLPLGILGCVHVICERSMTREKRMAQQKIDFAEYDA